MSHEPEETATTGMGAVLSVHRVLVSDRVARTFIILVMVAFVAWLVADALSTSAEQRDGLFVPLRLGLAVAVGAAAVWQGLALRRAFGACVWLAEEGILVRLAGAETRVPWSGVRAVRVETWRAGVNTLIFETATGALRLPEGLGGILDILSACRRRGFIDDRGLPRAVLLALKELEPPPS
jgi:hypothetical protein